MSDWMVWKAGRRVSLVVAVASAVVLGMAFPDAALAGKGGDKSKGKSGGLSAGLDGGYLGVGGGFFTENSRREGEETRQVSTDDQSYDYTSDDFFNGNIWYLTTLGNRVRAGAGLEYIGGYEAMRKPEEDEEADDIQPYEFGHLTNLYLRAEWLVPFMDDKQIVVGAQGGFSTLFPDGDFRQEIDDMKDQNISVFGGPRFGLDLAPLVGARWQIQKAFALRLDFSLHWQRLFLFNVSDTVEGVNFERTWTAKVLRYNLGLGIEVDL